MERWEDLGAAPRLFCESFFVELRFWPWIVPSLVQIQPIPATRSLLFFSHSWSSRCCPDICPCWCLPILSAIQTVTINRGTTPDFDSPLTNFKPCPTRPRIIDAHKLKNPLHAQTHVHTKLRQIKIYQYRNKQTHTKAHTHTHTHTHARRQAGTDVRDVTETKTPAIHTQGFNRRNQTRRNTSKERREKSEERRGREREREGKQRKGKVKEDIEEEVEGGVRKGK